MFLRCHDVDEDQAQSHDVDEDFDEEIDEDVEVDKEAVNESITQDVSSTLRFYSCLPLRFCSFPPSSPVRSIVFKFLFVLFLSLLGSF